MTTLKIVLVCYKNGNVSVFGLGGPDLLHRRCRDQCKEINLLLLDTQTRLDK